MGQQQLLLLVLATVIVGLATVAGIQAFEQGQNRANQDALTQQAVKIASDIQANLREPSQFGGAGLSDMSNGSFGGSGDTPTLAQLGYSESSSSDYFGSTPVYDFSGGECIIGGTATDPSSGNVASAPNSPEIFVDCASANNHIRAGISSLDPGGIESAAATNN